MNVSDVMHRVVHTCSIDDTLDRVARVMWEHDCGSVPLTDASGRLVAIVTDRDICMAAYTQGQPLAKIAASTAASRSVATVRENATLETVETLMRDHQIRRIPVVDAAQQPRRDRDLNDLVAARAPRRTPPRRPQRGEHHEDARGDLRAHEIMNVIEAIYGRRAVRAYAPRVVDDETAPNAPPRRRARAERDERAAMDVRRRARSREARALLRSREDDAPRAARHRPEDRALRRGAARSEVQHLLRRGHARRDRRGGRPVRRGGLLARRRGAHARGARAGPRHVPDRLRGRRAQPLPT